MEALAFSLLNDFQRGFPLEERPYRAIGARLSVSEAKVMETLEQLLSSGEVSRVGAVMRPGAAGASTLAAMAVAPAKLERVAARVSAEPGVNHNYAREHELNLWFVAAAPDAARLRLRLDAIARDTGIEVLALPLLEEFHIDLGFDLRADRSQAGEAAERRIAASHAAKGEAATGSSSMLDPAGRRLVAALAEGLARVARPYAELGARCNLSEADVIARLRAWEGEGLVRRLGVIVRHRALGYAANAMVVWDVPDAEATALGRSLARHEAVTLCYRRGRALPRWPYNLYCMVHGRERERVLEQVEALTRAAGLAGTPRQVLFGTTCFKQCAAHHGEAREPARAAA
jgi:DNA-binding Lrp family transcriptional regulator